MADITMCVGTKCSKKDTCYRFTAEPSSIQSYGAFYELEDCDMWLCSGCRVFTCVCDVSAELRIQV